MAIPKVILTTKFVYGWNIGGGDLLDYYARPEAFYNFATKGRTSYDDLDYMGNNEKSDGIFTADTDHLEEKDFDKFRELELKSRLQNCPKYVNVLSFDNSFLIENGAMVNGIIDKQKVKDVARLAINALIKNEKKFDADNMYWCGAIHTNTDNIHVHFSLLERERREDRLTKYRDKDMISEEALDKFKSTVVSKMIGGNKKVIENSKIEREVLLPKLKESFTNTTEQMKNLIAILPPEKGWQYNRPKMIKYQKAINDCVDNIYNSNSELKPIFEKYVATLSEIGEYSKDVYGSNKKEKYKDYEIKGLKEFYSRAGNILLKHLANLNIADVIDDDVDDSKTEINEDISQCLTEGEMIFEESPIAETIIHDKVIAQDDSIYSIEWSTEYKEALQYLYGNKKKGIKKDVNKAYRLLQIKAEKTHNVLAYHDIGKIIHSEMLADIEKERAEDYFKKAFDGFNSLLDTKPKLNEYIHYRIGKLYAYGYGVEKSDELAVAEYQKAPGNKYAQYSLGSAYKYGTGVEQDFEKAFILFQKSAEQKNPYSAYALAQAYENGEGTVIDNDKAYTNYKFALESFIKSSESMADDNLMYKIGMMYKNGKGTDVDIVKAKEWLLQSAESKNINAYYQLGRIAEQENDISLAEDYYVKAYLKKSDKAEYSLGKLYYKHCKDDITRFNLGLNLLISSATKGNANAQYTLGKEYLNTDWIKAESYLIASAEQKNQFAQYLLGKTYLSDKKNVAMGEKYLLASAEQNNQFAQYTLGKWYLKSQRIESGVKLLKASYEQGNEYAKYALERLSNPKGRIIPYRVKQKRYMYKNFNHSAMATLNMIYYQFDNHTKQLQAEFEYENEKNNQDDNDYDNERTM